VREQQRDHLERRSDRCDRRDLERRHGHFNPNNTTLNATYTPSAAERTAGTVTLTLTSASATAICNAVSDQVTYSITPAPTVTAGPDQTLCGNNANATLIGSFTVATGGSSGAVARHLHARQHER
jgi:hypothetical protein